MKIYLDYIFFENFLIDFILIKESAVISKENIKNTNAIMASIISATYVVIMTYFRIAELNYLACKVLLVTCMLLIAFRPKKLNKCLKLISIFLLVSVVNVGTIIVLKELLNIQEVTFIIQILIYVIGLGLSKLFMMHMWRIYKQDIKKNDLIYDVKIKIGASQYNYKAFLDTGNNVYSYTENMPVLFAVLKDDYQKKMLQKLEKFEINTVTLSSTSQKTAYVLNNIEITKRDKTHFAKAAVVFENNKLSKNNEYDMLLNYNLFVEKLGGIKI